MVYVRSSDRAVWTEKAICKGENVINYFPHGGAKKLNISCADCPVLTQCKEYALVHEEFGFWGGMTERDRRAYRKTTDFDLLVFQAKKEGWLESHNLASPSLLHELEGMSAIQANPQKPKASIKEELKEFNFSLFEFPTLSFQAL